MRSKALDKLKFASDARSKENGKRDIDEAISSIHQQIAAKQDQVLTFRIKLKAIEDLVAKNQLKIKHNKERMRDLEKDAFNYESMIKNIEEKEDEMVTASAESKLKKSQYDEYIKIKAKIHEDTIQMQQELASQSRALDRMNIALMLATNKKEDLERKITQIEHKIKATNESQKTEAEKIEELKAEFQELKLQSSQTEKQLAALYEDISGKEKESLLLKGEILSLEEEKEIRREERRVREILEELKKHQKGYYGFFYEFIHPIQNKFEIAIKVALQSVLKMLVVDSIEVASKVDEFLSEKGLYLSTLILEKVPQDPSLNIHSKRKKLEGKGHMIVDVVD